MMQIRRCISLKMVFPLKINEKLPLEKCLLVVEDYDSLVPCIKTEK